jgi:hypothetical protein
MGDNFLLQQVRNFKKGRDRAKVEQNQLKLFQRPDLLNTIYPAKPAEDVTFQIGEILLAVASKNGQHIDLARGHRRAGRTDGDAAKELLDALREPGSGGVVKVRVVEVCPVSGVAQFGIVHGEEAP